MSNNSLLSSASELQPNEESLRNNFLRIIERWQTNPAAFFEEALGIKSITSQQREGANALGRLVSAKLKKWEKKKLTEEEQEIANKEGISIMSGKGTGKDAFLSWSILWFLCCFRNSKIPLTGPSRNQMKDVLMAEIAKWVNRMDKNGNYYFIFRDDIVMLSDKIYMKDPESPETEGKSWFARMRTAPKNSTEEHQAKNMDGLHEDFMMIGVDEADGVKEAVLTSLETTLTGPINFILLIFNPTKAYGYAYETHFDTRSKYWVQLHWDSRFSENVEPEKVARALETYGEDAPQYRVNILGLPPEQNDETLIPMQWIDAALDREIAPDKPLRVMGADPSLGGDPTGVVIRDNHVIVDLLEFKLADTTEVAEELVSIFLEWECDIMYIDIIGVGAGVFSTVKRRLPGRVIGVDVSKKTRDKRKKYGRLRDELYWMVRTSFQDNVVSIPSKKKLTKKFKNELIMLRRDLEREAETGRIKILGKGKMKSMGLKSPNLAEAYMVTMLCRDSAFRPVEEKTQKRRDAYDLYEEDKLHEPQSWMEI